MVLWLSDMFDIQLNAFHEYKIISFLFLFDMFDILWNALKTWNMKPHTVTQSQLLHRVIVNN